MPTIFSDNFFFRNISIDTITAGTYKFCQHNPCKNVPDVKVTYTSVRFGQEVEILCKEHAKHWRELKEKQEAK